ncbi:MAG: hypothetical protein J6386_08675 [Candidatus Synoicihabitans palmerolidicus]|nr:hypothetical protein [Candidatus Synoicihabitans palmerolidicus]
MEASGGASNSGEPLGWAAWRRSVMLGVGRALLPGIAAVWWVHTADAIKAASPGAEWLQSKYLADFNFGT